MSQLELEQEYRGVMAAKMADESTLALIIELRDGGTYPAKYASERIEALVDLRSLEETREAIIGDLLKDEHEYVEMSYG